MKLMLDIYKVYGEREEEEEEVEVCLCIWRREV